MRKYHPRKWVDRSATAYNASGPLFTYVFPLVQRYVGFVAEQSMRFRGWDSRSFHTVALVLGMSLEKIVDAEPPSLSRTFTDHAAAASHASKREPHRLNRER